MIELLVKRDWSDDYLLPLTGLKKIPAKVKSYLFWRENTINDYKLVLALEKEEGVNEYIKNYLFPTLNKKGYLLENYDVGDSIIFILDMSEWAMDIEQFVKGKYSKLSLDAKKMIEKYHMVGNIIDIRIGAVMFPNKSYALLDKMTPIEYICHHYDLDLERVSYIGEIGSLYNEMAEKLVLKEDLYKQIGL